jgi:uncharacterized protein YjbI with pentapeptide repeats
MKQRTIWNVLSSLVSLHKYPQTQASSIQADKQRPPDDDEEAWRKRWEERGQPWRRRPEINEKRKIDLHRLHSMKPDEEQGIYPFKGVELSRADVEWLIEASKGKALDLQGVYLNGIDLDGMPLEKINLSNAQLKGTSLIGTILLGANLTGANLTEAKLIRAQLNNAHCNEAQLDKAWLVEAHLERADLRGTHLKDAFLPDANLEGAQLFNAKLNRANLSGANLNQAWLVDSDLEGANLSGADLRQAQLSAAKIGKAIFAGAKLEEANFSRVILADSKDGVGPNVADVRWENVNLSLIDWPSKMLLGDDYQAKQKKKQNGDVKNRIFRFLDFQGAVRANRQLSVALKGQGLDKQAARFAYRAQKLQAIVLWYQLIQPNVSLKKRLEIFLILLGTWFLYGVTGFGYNIGCSILVYLAVIFAFMGIYLHLVPGLSLQVALEVSVNACLSRGIPPGSFKAGDLASLLSDVEAVFGLIIEVVFIATLTQRFFKK